MAGLSRGNGLVLVLEISIVGGQVSAACSLISNTTLPHETPSLALGIGISISTCISISFELTN